MEWKFLSWLEWSKASATTKASLFEISITSGHFEQLFNDTTIYLFLVAEEQFKKSLLFKYSLEAHDFHRMIYSSTLVLFLALMTFTVFLPRSSQQTVSISVDSIEYASTNLIGVWTFATERFLNCSLIVLADSCSSLVFWLNWYTKFDNRRHFSSIFHSIPIVFLSLDFVIRYSANYVANPQLSLSNDDISPRNTF